MPAEPAIKRAAVFIDGQNLFHAAREAFGYTYPNYDVLALGRAICDARGWTSSEVHFYTGIPDQADDPRWHRFWTAKLATMGRQGVHVFSRVLRYRNRTLRLPDGTEHTFLTGPPPGLRRCGGLEPGPGPRRGGRRDSRDCPRAGTLDQDGGLVPRESEIPIARVAEHQKRTLDFMLDSLGLRHAHDESSLQDLRRRIYVTAKADTTRAVNACKT